MASGALIVQVSTMSPKLKVSLAEGAVADPVHVVLSIQSCAKTWNAEQAGTNDALSKQGIGLRKDGKNCHQIEDKGYRGEPALVLTLYLTGCRIGDVHVSRSSCKDPR